MKNRVLVTGAGGFLGQACLAALKSTDSEIHAVSRARNGFESGAVWHTADLFNDYQIQQLLNLIRPSHLLHLAWVTTPGHYWNAVENRDWVAASLRLLQVFAEMGGQRFVGAGTCAEYDWRLGGYCDEEKTPRNPSTLYGLCKQALWQAIEMFARGAGLSVAWGRFFFLYGPAENPKRLVASVTRSVLAQEPAYCTEGNQFRDFLHVGDAGSAFVALMNSPYEGPVNIGSGEPTKVSDVVTRIGTIVGRPDLIRLGALPSPKGEPALLAANIHRLQVEVGWRPRINLSNGLVNTVQWWAAHLSEKS